MSLAQRKCWSTNCLTIHLKVKEKGKGKILNSALACSSPIYCFSLKLAYSWGWPLTFISTESILTTTPFPTLHERQLLTKGEVLLFLFICQSLWVSSLALELDIFQ